MKPIIAFCTVTILTSLLSSCKSLPSNQIRSDSATSLAAQKNWIRHDINTGSFIIRSYLPHPFQQSDTLTVFIEGDGLAWLSKSKPSPDPTPVNHIVLKMALSHPQSDAVYLARPCQFNRTDNCPNRFWLQERFSPSVIHNMNDAVELLKLRFGAKTINFVGYSGGGAIASLLASKRKDVSHLITVAGNLDHKAWTEHHRISPLKGSLNPIDYSQGLQQNGTKQTHFIGKKDRIVPSSLSNRFVESQSPNKVKIIEIENFDHFCCWDKEWPELWKEAVKN